MSSIQKPFSSAGGFDARGKRGSNFDDPLNSQDVVTLNYYENNANSPAGPLFILDVLPVVSGDGIVKDIDPNMGVVDSVKVSGLTMEVILSVERGDRSEFIPYIKWSDIDDIDTATIENNSSKYIAQTNGSFKISLILNTFSSMVYYFWNGSRKVELVVEKSTAGIITSATISSPYPTTNSILQNEVKNNDLVSIEVTSDKNIKKITIRGVGLLSEHTQDYAGVGMTRVITDIPVSHSINGIAVKLNFELFIVDEDSITSSIFVSNINGINGVDYMMANNLIPSFPNNISVTYPITQGAIKTGENANVVCEVINFTDINYNTPLNELIIGSNNVYSETKSTTYYTGDYNISNENYNIVALRSNNGTTNSIYTIVNIANVAYTGYISPNLVSSSPSGKTINIVNSNNQLVNSITTFTVSGIQDTTVDNQIISGINILGNITTRDTDSRGDFNISVTGKNLANISTTISEPINLSGFSERTITLLGANSWTKQLIGAKPTDMSKLVISAIIGVGSTFPVYYDPNVINAGDSGSDTGNPHIGLEIIGNDASIIIDSNLQALALGDPNKDIFITIKQNA